MRTILQSALLVACACAEAGENAEFARWASKHGKNYKNVDEWQMRAKQFNKSKAVVADLNKRAEGKDLKFALNGTADLTDEEFKKRLGGA